jgi:VCBS repeat-containing protein
MAKSIARRVFNSARSRKFRKAAFRLESLESRNLLATGNPDNYIVNEDTTLSTLETVVPLRATGWDINDELLRSVNQYPTDAGGRAWNARDYDVATSTIGGTASAWETNVAAPFDCTTPNCTGATNALAAPKTNVHVPPATETTFLARKTFTLTAEQAAATSGSITFTCDSGCAFYINGVEAGRDTMAAGAITPNTFANGAGDEDLPNDSMTIDFAALSIPLFAGNNVFAVETHNDSTGSTDVGFDASLALSGGQPTVAANDVHGTPFTVALGTGPANGTLTLLPDGNFTYVPNANFNGTDTFTYTIADPTASPAVTVTITVDPVNDAPTVVNDNYFGTEGGTITITTPTAAPFTAIPFQSPGWAINDELLRTVNAYPTDGGARDWKAVDYDITTSVINGAPAAWEPSLMAPFQDGTVTAFNGQNPTAVMAPAATENTFLGRKTFTLTADQAAAPAGRITYTCDSGCIMYINGVRAGSSPNMATITTNIQPNTASTSAGDEDLPHDSFNVVFGGPGNPSLVAGTNVLAIETHNDSTASGDIGFDLQLEIIPLAGVLSNDSDVEGNSFTATVADTTNLAGKGTLTLNPNGTFTFAANPGVSGVLTFTYTASDGTTTSAPATVTMTLSAVDVSPYVAVADNYNATEDMALTVTGDSTAGSGNGGLMANDSHPGDENDLVTFSITRQPTGGTVALTGNTGGFVYTPRANFFGTDSFEYEVNDTFNPPSRANVTINVAGAPDAPTAVDDAYTTVEGQPINVTVPISPAWVPLRSPGWAINDEILNADNAYPMDGGGRPWNARDFNTATSVVGANPSPWDLNLTAGFEDGAVNALVNPTPVDVPNATETTFLARKTFTLNAAQAAATSGIITYVCDSGCVFYINGVEAAYSPNMEPTDTPPGPRPLTPTAFADDAGDEDDFDTLTIDFAALSIPLFVGDNVFAVEVHNDSLTSSDIGFDASLQGTPPIPGVLNNDVDLDGDALVNATVVTPPTGGNLTLNPDGTFTFTPNPGISGTQTFTYTVSDGTMTSAPATVTITISGTDSGIYTAVADTFSATEDTALTVTGNGTVGSTGGGLLANDTHPGDENDPLTLTVVTPPTHGTLTLTGNGGGFVYTPDADYAGPDSFSYSGNDTFHPVSTANVTIDVAAVDDAPESNGDTYGNVSGPLTVPVGTTYLGRRSFWEFLDTINNGQQNNPASPADPYPVDASSNPWNSEFFDTASGGGDGSWEFAQAVFSGNVGVDLNAVADNGGPIGTTVLDGIDCADNGTDNCVNTYLFRTNFTVPNGASLTAVGINLLADDGAIIYFNGVEVLRHNMAAAPAAVDTDDFATAGGTEDSYIRFDNVTFPAGTLHNGSNVVAVEVHQNNLTSTDVAFDMAITNAGPVSVLSNDVDKESDTLTAAVTTQPANGTVAMNPDGSFTYTPNAGFNGPTDTFTYTVSGLGPAAAASTVTLNFSTSPCTAGDADLDNNGTVNRADLAILSRNYGSTSPAADQGDVNCDGRIGVRDLIELRSRLSAAPSPAAPAAVVASVSVNAVDRVLAGIDRAVDAIGDRAPRATARLGVIRDQIDQSADNASHAASEARDAARRVIRATRGRLAAHARAIGDLFDRTA